MDVKELNKSQLILLAILLSFITSIATGIVTVSLMNQMPKSVPQTINNVIQRTIEKVTTVDTTDKATSTDTVKDNGVILSDGEALVNIYQIGNSSLPTTDNNTIPSAIYDTLTIDAFGKTVKLADSLNVTNLDIEHGTFELELLA